MTKLRFSYGIPTYGGCVSYGYEWPYFLHFLLPNLDQAPYYEYLHGSHSPQFDFENPWYDPAHFPPNVSALIPTFLCPDDSRASQIKTITIVPLTGSNYLGIFSGLKDWDNYKLTGYGDLATDGGPTNLPNPDPKQRAVFGFYSGTRIASITDGASNTMAVAEYLTGIDSNDMRGLINTNRAGSQFLYVTLTPNSRAPDNLLSWYPYSCPTDGSRDHPSDNLPCTPGPTDMNYASPRSRHPGGVNVLFCDGSIHFIPNDINLATWQSLGWIADGQAVSLNY